MNCVNCGAPMRENSNKCEYCNTVYEKQEPTYVINNYYSNDNQYVNQRPYSNETVYTNSNFLISPKNWLFDLLLCFFFGYFGIHKFYEGKIGMGILYIFTLGIFGLGWFVDFFIILFKKSKDKYGRLIK